MSQNLSSAAVVIGALRVKAPITTVADNKFCDIFPNFLKIWYVFCSVLCLLCLCVRLFICALWSPAGKGLTSWLSFVVSNCEFVAFPLVSWVRCGT